MRTFPVLATALRATAMVVGQINKGDVTEHAQAEEIGRHRQVEAREHFTKLLKRGVGPDEQRSEGVCVGREAPVARQEVPCLAGGARHDRRIRTCRTLGVEAEHAQPARQSLEHGIGEKARRRCVRSHPMKFSSKLVRVMGRAGPRRAL